MKNSKAVEFGRMYRDVITGFKGVATGKAQYITGCDQVSLDPRMVDADKPTDSRWFDVERLEACQESGVITLNNDETSGADMEAPVK